MTVACEYFWGPDSVMKMPYMASSLGTQAAFFARMVGICFGIITLGRKNWGTSNKTWTKQTLCFHVATLYMFYQASEDTTGAFTKWVWQMQCGVNAVLALWGKSELDKLEGKK